MTLMAGMKNNREALNSFLGGADQAEILELQDPEKFKKALEKTHLLNIDTAHRTAHEELDNLKRETSNKSPEERLDALINFAEAPNNNETAPNLAAAVTMSSPELTELSPEQQKILDAKKEIITKRFKKNLAEKKGFGSGAMILWGMKHMEEATETLQDEDASWVSKTGAVLKQFFLGLFLGSFPEYKKHQDEIEQVTTEEEDKEQNEVPLEKKMKSYNNMGRIMVQSMGGENFIPNDNFDFVLNEIEEKNITYRQLKEGKVNYDENSYSNKVTQERFDKVVKAITGPHISIIGDSVLQRENIEKIMNNEKAKTAINKIGIGNISTFNWRSLSIDKLNKLLGIVLARTSISALSAAGNISGDIINKMYGLLENTSFGNIKKDLKEDMQSYQEDVMPSGLFVQLNNNREFKQVGSLSFNRANIMEAGIDKKYEKYIDQIILFRSFVEKDILSNQRYTLGVENIHVTLSDVIQLYMLFEGKGGMSEINKNKLKSSSVYPWIWKILDRENNAGDYISALIKEIVPNDETNNIDKDDRLILRIIMEKIGDEGFIEPLQKALETAKDIALDNVEHVGTAAIIVAVLQKLDPRKRVKFIYKIYGVAAGYATYLWGKLTIEERDAIKKQAASEEEKETLKKLEDTSLLLK